MEKTEFLRLFLIELMNEGLLNKFVEIVFNYKLSNDDCIYVQYKVANGNIVMNIYDNIVNNRFQGYIFLKEDNKNYILRTKDDGTSLNYVYLNKCYDMYKNKEDMNNLVLFAVLLISENEEEKNPIIDELFPEEIKKCIDKIKRKIIL